MTIAKILYEKLPAALTSQLEADFGFRTRLYGCGGKLLVMFNPLDACFRRLLFKNTRALPIPEVLCSDRLSAEIMALFGVSLEFIRQYQAQNPHLDWTQSNWADFTQTLSDLQRSYVTFAMSSVCRGNNLASLLKSRGCLGSRQRFLDIGTGYGGFLRSFWQHSFQSVVGIELQPSLVALARANNADLLDVQVLEGDFLKDTFSDLGLFDVVTCNDVIEHVNDPALAIQKMVGLLKPGGWLCLEVPNKDCIPFVISDGHFGLFGITQLDRSDAADYYAAALKISRDGYFFEMGDMLELNWYLMQLRANQLHPTVRNRHAAGRLAHVPALLSNLKKTYKHWQSEKRPDLPTLVGVRLSSAVDTYIEELETGFDRVTGSKARVAFHNKYLQSFWTILACKHAP